MSRFPPARGFPPSRGLPPSGPPRVVREYDVVRCVVCSKKLRVDDADRLDQPPLCSTECAEKWESTEDQR